MKIVSISDYAIHHRIGRSEPTGTTYITRFGNTRQKNVFKEFYKTNIGEFTPEDRKSTRLNSSHWNKSRMPSSA